eukprot:488423_1
MEKIANVTKIIHFVAIKLNPDNPYFFAIKCELLKKIWHFGCEEYELQQWIDVLRAAIEVTGEKDASHSVAAVGPSIDLSRMQDVVFEGMLEQKINVNKWNTVEMKLYSNVFSIREILSTDSCTNYKDYKVSSIICVNKRNISNGFDIILKDKILHLKTNNKVSCHYWIRSLKTQIVRSLDILSDDIHGLEGYLLRKIGCYGDEIGERIYFRCSKINGTLEYNSGIICIVNVEFINILYEDDEHSGAFMIGFDENECNNWTLIIDSNDKESAMEWVKILQDVKACGSVNYIRTEMEKISKTDIIQEEISVKLQNPVFMDTVIEPPSDNHKQMSNESNHNNKKCCACCLCFK